MAASSEISTSVPGWVWPEITGRRCSNSVPFAGDSIVGADGKVSVTVKATASASSDALPAASVAVAVTLCSPSVSAAPAAHWNVPAAVAVAAQTCSLVLASITATEDPASAVPLSVGSRFRVRDGGWSSTGAAGGVVSMTRARAALGLETWLSGSVTTAWNRYAPSASADGLQLHVPEESAVAVQTATSPSWTETAAPAAACPVSTGEVSRVGERGTSNAGVLSVRTLSGTAVDGPLWFPTCVTWNAVKR